MAEDSWSLQAAEYVAVIAVSSLTIFGAVYAWIRNRVVQDAKIEQLRESVKNAVDMQLKTMLSDIEALEEKVETISDELNNVAKISDIARVEVSLSRITERLDRIIDRGRSDGRP